MGVRRPKGTGEPDGEVTSHSAPESIRMLVIGAGTARRPGRQPGSRQTLPGANDADMVRSRTPSEWMVTVVNLNDTAPLDGGRCGLRSAVEEVRPRRALSSAPGR